MSDQGFTGNWDAIAADVTKFLNMAQPLIAGAEAVFPAGAPAIEIGTELLKGVLTAEPTAKALVDRFTSGTPPTQDELATYIAARKAAFAQLDADLSKT